MMKIAVFLVLMISYTMSNSIKGINWDGECNKMIACPTECKSIGKTNYL